MEIQRMIPSDFSDVHDLSFVDTDGLLLVQCVLNNGRVSQKYSIDILGSQRIKPFHFQLFLI